MPTAKELGIDALTGSKKQIEWAEALRDKAINHIWKQGWHYSYESLVEDARHLPLEASWWIDNCIAGCSHEAARRCLGLEYTTPAGADY